LATAPLNSVKISGPSVVQPGTSSQFVATATFSDQTTSDVTASSDWKTSNATVFTISTPGLVTAVGAGEGLITVSYQGRFASLNVVSLPAGTGIVGGHVTQVGLPVASATVEIIGGPFAGKSAVCDSNGSYRLYGVTGDLQIRATKGGYAPLTKQVTVAPFATPRRDQMLDFEMSLASPPVALAGTYRATLRASASCSGKLPSDVMVRNYTAAIAQDGERLTVVLSGAVFATDSHGVPTNSFTGRIQPNVIQLSLGTASYYYYYYYFSNPGFVERLLHAQVGPWGVSQNDYLSVAGTAYSPISQSIISATLSGTLSLQTPNGTSVRTLGSCYASDHQLILTRQ
jgi:hypothetical protein